MVDSQAERGMRNAYGCGELTLLIRTIIVTAILIIVAGLVILAVAWQP
jgi:hypothetical protein